MIGAWGMGYEHWIAIFLIGYGLASYLVWSAFREIAEGIDQIHTPIKRYAARSARDTAGGHS